MAKAVRREPAESQDWSDVAQEIGRRARAASRALAAASSNTKNDALAAMAASLRNSADAILKENAADLAAAKAAGLSAAMLDRLSLTQDRLKKLAASLDEIAALRDPVGEIIEGYTRPNGLQIMRLRVPLGVVLTIYESRPNVTSDVAALCLKSGNAAILRGGKESLRSNLAIHRALSEAVQSQGQIGRAHV